VIDPALVGDRYRIGTALFEVTQPRVTCYRVGIRMNDPRIPALLVSHRRPGFYFRVLEEGEVRAGDEIFKVASGEEQMTVAEVDALLYLPGQADMRRAVQSSAILSTINDAFPPERLLEQLERVDPIGVVAGPPAIVAPPDSRLARDPDVVTASKSVVRITGIACGLGVEGSGWIVRRGLVVTNAHVVAGIDAPRVDRRDGTTSRRATVVAFDERNDVAVLRVPGLRGRPLPVAEPERGVGVVLVGFPGNGPLTLTPGRLGGTRDLIGRNAYGRGPVTREITTIRGVIEPGSSGGPGVDARGRVRTTVFARQPGDRGGYGIPPDVVLASVQEAGREPVSATDCTR